MTEDEKLRFIVIVSAIVAALAVHRFLDTSQALAHSTGVRFFALSGSGFGGGWLGAGYQSLWSAAPASRGEAVRNLGDDKGHPP